MSDLVWIPGAGVLLEDGTPEQVAREGAVTTGVKISQRDLCIEKGDVYFVEQEKPLKRRTVSKFFRFKAGSRSDRQITMFAKYKNHHPENGTYWHRDPQNPNLIQVYKGRDELWITPERERTHGYEV